MKTRPTAIVLRGELQCRGVEASLRTHREGIGNKLTSYWTPFTPEGAEPVDYRKVLESKENGVRDIRLDLVESEQANLDAKVSRNRSYNAMQRASGAARDHLLDFKSSVEGIHGEESHVQLGLSGTMPSAPIEVGRQGKRLYDLLEKPEELSFAGPSEVGARMDFADARKKLKPLLDDLQVNLTTYDDAKRIAEQALERRRRAENRYRTELRAIAESAEGYYRLVGEHEAADRLRIAARRRLGDPTPEPTPEPAPPQETVAASGE